MLERRDLEVILEQISGLESRMTQKIVESEARMTERASESEAKITKLKERFSESEERMTQKIVESEGRMAERLSESETKMMQKIVESEERMAEKISEAESRMMAYFEAAIMPKFDLLAEGHKLLLDTMAPKSRVEALEDEVAFMKQIIRVMTQDIAELKKAQ